MPADTASSAAVTSPAPVTDKVTHSYQEILAQAPAVQKSLSETEQVILEETAKTLIENNVTEAKQMITTWIKRDPDEPMPMLLLAQAYLKSGQYKEALDIALDLRSRIQADIPTEDINELISDIESLYSIDLYSKQQFDRLLSLYQTLTSVNPEKSKYYYNLAQIQHELAQHSEALTSLDYILYDEVWGERAKLLAQRIQLNVDLKDQIEIPLERSDNQFTVEISVNGIPGVKLLIDTGASISVLRPQAAEQLGLFIDEDKEITINLPAGVVNTPTTKMDLLTIGDATLENILASIIEMPPGIEADGLLGMNVLGRFRFFIDQQDAILYLGAR